MTDVGADLDLIVAAALEAGRLAVRMRDEGLTVEIKPDKTQVTNADLATDALLTERLRTARPDYGWLSEETADNADRLSNRRLFVVDPIDGTRAFIRDRPWWAVSIAVVEDGLPIAGVVFAPDVEETYTAIAGEGAKMNGAPIHASDCNLLEGCGMIGDERMFLHPSWPEPWPSMRIEARNSTAYRMCLVAAGTFDAAIAIVRKSDWDLAAADLIAREAGAYCGDHLGKPFAYNQANPSQPSLVCAAPRLAPLILNRVGHIALRN
ncbi:3'(2'),5'-bisphosphate nucleotidase CysQ [Phenylobacterium sp.]|uniref:3'(2'),5'-bisphosphate nucleotidase CysQ n=1 Tax=Phenylobacterium sp. TaxID=1871053 RepID=UPI0030F379CB